MYKLRGQVTGKKKETINTQKGDFEKFLFQITESDTGFDHSYQFEIFGTEAIVMHESNIIENRWVTVEFYIKSREYNGRYYNTLMVKSVHLEELNENTADIF
tara:strand:+ start:3603 stop:3908 length:306 start_codon:yes stop_codon:yes gene_type:complete